MVKPRTDRPQLQGAIIKRLQTGYAAVPTANDVTANWMNAEYNRLRTLDNAGLKHKMYMKSLANRKRFGASMRSLEQQKINLANKRTDDAVQGAMLGGLLQVGGIAYNKAEQKEQAVTDAKTDRINAAARMETTRARIDNGGTPSQFAKDQFRRDWTTVHKDDPSPEPNYTDDGKSGGIIKRIFGGN